MHFSKFVALVALFAGGALATPTDKPPKPVKPVKPAPPPPPPTQQNACGNGATPYCCNADGKGAYGSCYSYEFSSQCSATVICCNAQNSVQVCIGNANLFTPPYYPYQF
ncbi:MAG: hypothetical protein Q9169_005605 [Polycauliona sp. 2 TL-2023]